MTVSSMTGFARAEGQMGVYGWSWELKSVNAKGLDMRVRLPPGLDALEGPVRERIAAKLKRGNVTAGLTVARDGTIWARVAMPSERIPDAELPPRRENSPPPRMYRSPAEYEVFVADGRFLGRVAMPPRTTVTTADGEFVWAITRDADDLPAVVRYRLSIPFSPE